MPATRLNGVTLYWDLTGQTGDLVVLVHGSWGDHHNWDAVVPGLARSLRVVTFDRRGHSQSERRVEPVFRLVVDRIAPVLPRSTTQTFAGAGHVPHLSHPEEYVRIITRFLTSLPR